MLKINRSKLNLSLEPSLEPSIEPSIGSSTESSIKSIIKSLIKPDIKPDIKLGVHIASFNACNFGEWSSPEKIQALLNLIAIELNAPDIIGLQEIGAKAQLQIDNVPALVMQNICAQLLEQYSLVYQYHEIAPQPDENGGEQGLNIRCVFLVKAPAKISIILNKFDISQDISPDIPADISKNISQNNALSVHNLSCFKGDPELGFSPSRPPLVAILEIDAKQILIINCHLKSMRAHPKKLGRIYKKQRHAQAQYIADIAHQYAHLPCIILGDMNDVPSSKTLSLLCQPDLNSALDKALTSNEHTVKHGGRPVILDYIIFNHHLKLQNAKIHMLHTQNPSSNRLSDHNPISASFIIKQ